MHPVTRMIPFILAPEGSRGVKTGCIENDEWEQAAALNNRAAACFVPRGRVIFLYTREKQYFVPKGRVVFLHERNAVLGN